MLEARVVADLIETVGKLKCVAEFTVLPSDRSPRVHLPGRAVVGIWPRTSNGRTGILSLGRNWQLVRFMMRRLARSYFVAKQKEFNGLRILIRTEGGNGDSCNSGHARRLGLLRPENESSGAGSSCCRIRAFTLILAVRPCAPVGAKALPRSVRCRTDRSSTPFMPIMFGGIQSHRLA